MIKYIVLIGGAANLFGIFFYLRGTLRGKIKPNKVTWLMWSIAPLIATCAALNSGVRWAVIPVFMSGFGPLLVFIVSFFNKQSYWKLSGFDYLCGFFSFLALILWWITKQPDVAIVFAIISDTTAAIPTILKSWQSPETENSTPYSTGVFSALTSFAAISIWNFSQLAFPIYLVIINSLLFFSVNGKKLFNL